MPGFSTIRIFGYRSTGMPRTRSRTSPTTEIEPVATIISSELVICNARFRPESTVSVLPKTLSPVASADLAISRLLNAFGCLDLTATMPRQISVNRLIIGYTECPKSAPNTKIILP